MCLCCSSLNIPQPNTHSFTHSPHFHSLPPFLWLSSHVHNDVYAYSIASVYSKRGLKPTNIYIMHYFELIMAQQVEWAPRPSCLTCEKGFSSCIRAQVITPNCALHAFHLTPRRCCRRHALAFLRGGLDLCWCVHVGILKAAASVMRRSRGRGAAKGREVITRVFVRYSRYYAGRRRCRKSCCAACLLPMSQMSPGGRTLGQSSSEWRQGMWAVSKFGTVGTFGWFDCCRAVVRVHNTNLRLYNTYT